LRHARRALAISRHTATEFRKANPAFAALPIDVCWPATPPESPIAAAAVRRPGFALIVGRLSSEDRYKGHDVLIDVWPEVRRAVPDARLVVAGTGDDQARLRARVAAAGLNDAVEFAGSQTPAALAALYRDCAFLEAMAAGRACIGGPGAAQEIIVDNSSGLIVDSDRPWDVRDALVRLFADPDLCARFGDAGRRRAREVFSVDRFERELAGHLARGAPPAMVTTPC
jgi:glycosyltransferase involved in cell wall biosynthesis